MLKTCALFIALFLFCTTGSCQMVTDSIRLNQVGFYTHAPKKAFVISTVTSDEFYITSTNLRDTFFTGKLGPQKRSTHSATKTRLADFTPLQQKGIYVLLVPGVGHSYVFSIADNVHKATAIAALKGFYYQRTSMPLEEKYAGKWRRTSGHPDTNIYIHPSAASAQRPALSTITSPGGWYDAGDYNKYIVNSGITMGTMLSAYEDFKKYFDTLHTNIPESSDKVPDLLNEIIYNLRWMLTMQDPFDGGVYHKCTNATFDGMVMPGVTKAPRYVVQKSAAAALDFAAVTAQAARILSEYSKATPRLADSCLKASVKAWQWAVKNKAVLYDQNSMNGQHKPEVTTGDYGDKKVSDEWLWAAAELFITTSGKNYWDTVLQHLNDEVGLPSWNSVGLLGYYSLLRQQKYLPYYTKPVMATLKTKVLSLADESMAGMANTAFNTVMGASKKDFIWGSNAVAANQGIVLVNAYLLTGNKNYINGALSNIDYLLGRNATGYCFITGSGSKSTMHPHHRPSVADGITEPVPGLLAGGPNPSMQDKCTYPFTETETAYTDTDCSYASNEIAINWNAPLVYLLHAMEAVQHGVFKK